MGILKAMKSSWKAATTAEKLNFVLDLICGFGAGAIGGTVTKKLLPNMNKIEQICAGITMGGLTMAAGTVAAKAYEPYTEAVGKIVDTAKAKAKAAEEKEEEANGRA